MTDSPGPILIDGGKRTGSGLQAEPLFRAKIGEGYQVFTQRNGVFFQIGLDGDRVVYKAMPKRPEGV